ncbi:hypothetical protein HAX54_042497 [Datura stramonium]|uniref:Uncharacterized protein n=1 Tax=Datura stramonium TaxID=4076 RepID=A0ABS8VZF5_DATST|nr:hypothetical protein [Datura stramonium]
MPHPNDVTCNSCICYMHPWDHLNCFSPPQGECRFPDSRFYAGLYVVFLCWSAIRRACCSGPAIVIATFSTGIDSRYRQVYTDVVVDQYLGKDSE